MLIDQQTTEMEVIKMPEQTAKVYGLSVVEHADGTKKVYLIGGSSLDEWNKHIEYVHTLIDENRMDEVIRVPTL